MSEQLAQLEKKGGGGGALPDTLEVYLSNALQAQPYQYMVIPQDIVANYSTIKFTQLEGYAAMQVKYGNIDTTGSVTSATLGAALTNDITTTAATIVGITNDLVLGAWFNRNGTIKFTLEK